MNSYKTSGLVKDKYLIFKRSNEPKMHLRCWTLPPIGRDQDFSVDPVDKDAQYFPLRVDADPHARAALIKYATSVGEDNPQLRDDIFVWLDELNDLRPDWLKNSEVVWMEDDGGAHDRERFPEAWKRLAPDVIRVFTPSEVYDGGDYHACLYSDGWIAVASCEGSEIRRTNEQ